MASNYVTQQDIKQAQPDTAWGTKYDVLLENLASWASREFDRLTHREAGEFCVSGDTIRYFDGSGDAHQWIDNLAAAPTTVEVDELGGGTYTTWASTDYITYPRNAVARGVPITRLDVSNLTNCTKSVWYAWPNGVKITGKFGWSTTPPEDVTSACCKMALREFKRFQQAYQDTGSIPDLGQLHYTKGSDPEVDNIVRLLRRVST